MKLDPESVTVLLRYAALGVTVLLKVGYPKIVKAVPGDCILADEGLLNVTSTPALPIAVPAPITTTTSVAGATLVSATPVFTDTRADSSLYSSANIPETLDKTPITVQSYYLHRVNGVDTAFINPMFITSDNNIREFTAATFKSIMKEWINFTAASSTAGYSLSYNINGGGVNRGTGMANTILNGSGNYQTLQVGADDYRAQEFPDGTPVTATTYFLKILQS